MEYEIYIRAEDGRHKLDNPPMSLEDAQEKAREWLGRIAEWTSETRAVSMYGQVLTIEAIAKATTHIVIDRTPPGYGPNG